MKDEGGTEVDEFVLGIGIGLGSVVEVVTVESGGSGGGKDGGEDARVVCDGVNDCCCWGFG